MTATKSPTNILNYTAKSTTINEDLQEPGMKILHVVGSMDPASGGICQAIRNSIPEMTLLGSSCEVVCLDDPAAAFIKLDTFPIHALGPAKGPWQYAAKLKPWLIANVSRFDVVIINGAWIYASFITSKIISNFKNKQLQDATLKVPRLFIMPHGMFDPYFQNAPGRRLKAIRNWVYWKLIEAKIVNDADGLLFTCEAELKLARTSLQPYRPKKEVNVGFGIVSPPEFSQEMYQSFLEKCPGIDHQPFLLFLGRIHEKKGVDLLIKAYADVAGQAVTQNRAVPKLVIAGPGLDTPFGKEMIHLSNLHPRLHGLVLSPGMLTGNAKWGALYSCDAFILPSHQENFGVAIVEAMACKKAVMISDQVNIWAEINEGGGAIVGADTLEATTASLVKWLKLSIAEQQNMGKKALATFQKQFNIHWAAKAFLKAIG